MEELLLYSYRRCPFAMRVRFALHEKGISFKVKEEDLKNFSKELRQLHPEAKVPLLVHGSRVIYESAIITEYIDETFKGTLSLMPSSSGERAEVRLWTYWCNQIFKPDLDRFKYGTARFSESDCVGVEERIAKHLNKIEERLKIHSWLVGDQFSLADIHVFPFLRQLKKINPAPEILNDFVVLNSWIEKINSREAFKRTIEK